MPSRTESTRRKTTYRGECSSCTTRRCSSATRRVSDFSDSVRLADRRIAELFFWHCQQRSVIGFIMMTDGRRDRQSRQKVLYATALIVLSSCVAASYTRQTVCFDTEEGSNLMSDLLYPGTLPGNKMPFCSA